MEWDDKKTAKHEKIRGMHTYPPQTVSTHRVEEDFRKGDIEWEVELRASEAGSTGQTVHPEVQTILDRYATVFGEIPPGQPPDRGFEHIIELVQIPTNPRSSVTFFGSGQSLMALIFSSWTLTPSILMMCPK